MAAGPGEEAYGRLSVMLQYRCQVEPLFTVGPEAFRPPKVRSAVVRLVPRETLPVAVRDERLFAEVVRRAFAQRRKDLTQCLARLVGHCPDRSGGVNPGARPETLDLAAFTALSAVAPRADPAAKFTRLAVLNPLP